MAATVTRIRWDRRAVRELGMEPGVQDTIQLLAKQMVELLRATAARDTGAGAESIDVRPDRRMKDAVDVGWDAAHYYLIFPEYGTKFQEAQRFARRALYEHTYQT